MRRHLFHILLWSQLLVIAAAMASAGWFCAYLGERQVVRQRTEAMTQLARVMAPEATAVFARPLRPAAGQDTARDLGVRAQCRVTLIHPDGVVAGDSEEPAEAVPRMDNHRSRPEVAQALQGGTGSSLRYSATLHTTLLYVALSLHDANRTVGVLRVAIPLTEVTRLRGAIRRAVAVSLGIGGLVALLLSFWSAQRIARPIRQMTEVADAVAGGHLEAQAPAAAVAEVHQLGQALTAMAQALQRHVTSLTIERNQATAILGSMAEGVVALDHEGRILLLNPAAAEFFGVAAGQAAGRPFLDVVRHHELSQLIEQVSVEQQPVTKEFTIFQPTERMLRARAVSCEGGSHGAPRTVVVIQDLTQAHEYERLRKEFVANVSHELKTPLTAIRGLTETLLEGALGDPSHNRRFVGLIDEEAGRLGRLIDDLLSLGQIESGAAPLRLQAVNLAELVKGLLPALQSEAAKRRLILASELPAAPQVRADPDRLKQVFINLLDNAIKYNREGGTIHLRARPDGAMLRVEVADTGIGIPAADLPHIFERFYRVDKARSRELGGTGLGLAIVKHIVEAHGGTITVASRPDEGSTFSVTLPLSA